MNIYAGRTAVFGLTFVILLLSVAANASAQTTRAATAASYLQRGQAWLERGETERALADFDLAVASDPTAAAAWFARGMARRNQGDLAGALADLDQSLKLAPRSARGRQQRAATLYLQGKLDEAEADLDAAVKLDSRFAEAYNDRGVLRHLRGDVTAAIGDYDAALRLRHRFAKAWMNRGIARLEQGRRADAERDFAECLRLDWAVVALLFIVMRPLHRTPVVSAQLGVAVSVDPGSIGHRHNAERLALDRARSASAWRLFQAHRSQPAVDAAAKPDLRHQLLPLRKPEGRAGGHDAAIADETTRRGARSQAGHRRATLLDRIARASAFFLQHAQLDFGADPSEPGTRGADGRTVVGAVALLARCESSLDRAAAR